MNDRATSNEDSKNKPLVVITGAAGSIGQTLATMLSRKYRIVGLDLSAEGVKFPCIEFDITEPKSVDEALAKLRAEHGGAIASVVHLAAYFDFSGKESPLYEKVNEQGTRNLLHALKNFEVSQFVYSSTMLVHEPVRPGELITEDSTIAPKWAYPKSKARTEQVIRDNAGDIPYVLLRLAGLYDEWTAAPTLSHQIARIYQWTPKSRLFAGNLDAGQAMIHREDTMALFRSVVDRREALPKRCEILAGEDHVMSYGALQQEIGELVHGVKRWRTHKVPAQLARLGAWIEEKSEPVMPDDFDYGEKPFIRPFMIDMASDHYALDTTRARELLGWKAERRIEDELPATVERLKSDPLRWYRENAITPPHWLTEASEIVDDPDRMRERHLNQYRRQHRSSLWTQWFNLGLALWLITSPPLLGYTSGWMTVSDVVSGLLLMVFAFAALSWRHGWARWASAAIGCWVMSAPLIFWAPQATAYLNGTLVGALIVGFAVLVPPYPGIAAIARRAGPDVPEGWDYSPSAWFQRLPVIFLALVGLYISRYLAAYQLGYIEGIWEPFFGSDTPGRNGTEAIITSQVSQAWPVPDAGLGALTYMLEILVGVAGAANRWRTMPWLVMLFGLMIVPLGAVSIYFIVIQPVLLGTYCTLCLVAAAAMLVQIPYSVDELIACGQYLARQKARGRPVLKLFFTGGGDTGARRERDDFEQPPPAIVREMVGGGMSVPWNLGVTIAIGIWLMLTPFVFDASVGLANANHVAGAVVLTITVSALAEVARPLRLMNVFVGLLLVLSPFALATDSLEMINSIVAGLALMALNLRRGKIRNSYGGWDRYIL
jgi:nucleoside-diphosphate-sugar epimerase/uncharacterized membrane protein